MIDEKLSLSILNKYEEVSKVFGDFQKKNNLHCPTGCGKCCFNPEISCTPYELIPMALHLLATKKAEVYLEEAKIKKDGRCLFLKVTDEEKGLGSCREYEHRPFLCRAFGISARHGKNNQIEYNICKVFKDTNQITEDLNFAESEIPFIEIWNKNLETLDPHFLEKEIPINHALIAILEKVLLWDSYQEKN